MGFVCCMGFVQPIQHVCKWLVVTATPPEYISVSTYPSEIMGLYKMKCRL